MKKKINVFCIIISVFLVCVSCSNEPVAQPFIETPVTTPVSTPAATLTPLPEPTSTPRPAIPIDEDGYILTCSDYDLNNDGQKDFFGFRKDVETNWEGYENAPVLMLDYYKDGGLSSVRLWSAPNFWGAADHPDEFLPIVNEYAVGDYDGDGFLEIAAAGYNEKGNPLELVVRNPFGSEAWYNFMDAAAAGYYSAEGFDYRINESSSSAVIYSDFNDFKLFKEKNKFAGIFELNEIVLGRSADPSVMNHSYWFADIDHIETISYPDGDALLCRQLIPDYGYMWFSLRWDPKPSTSVFGNICYTVEEWFQPAGAQRDKYRSYKAVDGYPYGDFGGSYLQMYAFNDSRLFSENIGLEITIKETSLVLSNYDNATKTEQIVTLPWNIKELVWGIGADVNCDKLREMLVVGKDTNGKGKLGVVTALAKKPQLYTLEFDKQSIETAEIVPYQDMYIINCLVKDTSGKQEWQAYKLDNGKFVGLTQKDVADNHPAKLFREKQK